MHILMKTSNVREGLLDDDTLAWTAEVYANGGSVTNARRLIINNYIRSLKGDGIWPIIDRIWVLGAENALGARTDLKARVLAGVVGSPTFTTNQGYAGTDVVTATNYLTTGFNPSTAGGNFTQNSGHLAAWCGTQISITNGGCSIGINESGSLNQSQLFITWTDSNEYFRLNSNSSNNLGPINRIGFWVISRTGSNTEASYKNGVVQTNHNSASVAMANRAFYILADNNAGTANSGQPNRHALISIGGGLTSTQVADFYTHSNTLSTAVGGF